MAPTPAKLSHRLRAGMVAQASASGSTGAAETTAHEHDLRFWERGPPLAAIAAAQMAGLDCHVADDDKFTKDSQPALEIKSERCMSPSWNEVTELLH